jgi:adenylate cyclase
LTRALVRGVAVGALSVVAGLSFLAMPLGIGVEEWAGLGLLFKLRGPRTPPSDVVVVAIDRPAAEALGLPLNAARWPRSYHADLIDALHQGGAAVIVFDVVFDEPGTPFDDRRLAESMQRAGTVLLAQQLLRESVTAAGRDPRTSSEPFHVERLASPLPSLAQAAAGVAPFPLPKVPVQVSRYWTFKAGAGNAPSLPVVAFHVYAREAHASLVAGVRAAGGTPPAGIPPDGAALARTGRAEETVRALREAVERDPAVPAKLRSTALALPPHAGDPRQRRLLERLVRLYGGPASPYLDFYGPSRTIATVPYDLALLRTTAGGKPIDVRGKAVFIGLSAHTAAEQKDGVHTVFSEPNGLDLSGVEIAATAFGNLLEGRSVRPLTAGAQVALAIGWGLLLGLLAWRLPPLASAALLLLAAGFYLAVAQSRFAAGGLWLPLVGPLALQAPVAFAASVLWRHRDTRREREHLTTALAHYLPPRIAEELAREIGDVRAADQLVFGTCLSTDAHQYTTLSETMDPAELSALMNRYYAVLFEPVKQHGGLVQDVVGDSMLAVWATSKPDASLRSRACLAALDIASAVDRFNLESGRLALPTRLGLHSGRLLLGSVGAIDHYEYRAVGDIVNTATRLEGLNKHLGTRILVSADVLDGLPGLSSRELGAFLLAGKSRPVLVHELLAREGAMTGEDRERYAMFAAALAAYRSGAWDQATRIWQDVLRAHGGNDGPSRFYLRWCESHAGQSPGANWDGVVRMDQK